MKLPNWKFRCLLVGLALAACSDPRPPVGRWQGAYEDSDVIVVARLEIAPNGSVRVSAPNAILSDAALSLDDRNELHKKLDDGLARSWPSVEPLSFEFDGKAFRKPGGVAPQLEWDADKKRMSLIYYSANRGRASVRVPLAPVRDFDS
jgi:hypothetical protein